MAEENRNILLVDDDPYMLDALKRCLREHYTIHAVSDPIAAIQMIKDGGCFSVAIADIHMPKMNGADLLIRIAELSPATVRIAMTGMIDVETRRRTLEKVEIFRYLTKPCSVYHLLDVLDEAVEVYRRRAAALAPRAIDSNSAAPHPTGMEGAPELPVRNESKVIVPPQTATPFPVHTNPRYLFGQA